MTSSSEHTEFEALLDYIKRNRGFDFTGYKYASLQRRFTRRMQMLNIDSFGDYQDYLEVHPEEFGHLFNTLLINVTSFFRDRPAWEYLQREVIPQIVSRKLPKEQIRIWSAGCSSGEEAYSIAIALAEIIGVSSFRERVKIYATDVDEEALNQARQATYHARQLTGLLPQHIEQFFEQTDPTYTFSKNLRRSVIFGRHDLIQDAPISRIDLLLCRNTLMYFNAETQSRILSRFHFALQDQGLLFLGKAEMLLTHADIFSPVQLKYRVFAKVPRLSLRNSPLVTALTEDEAVSPSPNHARLREAAFDSEPSARLVIDVNGMLALVNDRAQRLFNLSLQDLGRPLQDLEVSYRPVELRSCIQQVYSERRVVQLQNIEWQTPQTDVLCLDVQLAPLFAASDGSSLGVSITFIDVTRYKHLQQELEHSNQELELAYEELQSTNEELETTNEELQSSSEELETTNEELQSTNEELETMNEELQSTNEELRTVNDELHRRSEELNQSNAFLASILTSLRGGVVVVNRDLQVQIWNHRAEDLWGLRTEEAIGTNFLNLDIGLPVEQLRQPIRACLAGTADSASEVVLSAINRRGRNFQCRVTCTPLVGYEGQIKGVILVMEERPEAGE